MKSFLLILFTLTGSTFFAQKDSVSTKPAPDSYRNGSKRNLISGGIGFSNVQFVYTQAKVLIEQPSLKRSPINANFQPHSSVVLNAEYDFRLFRHFSIGAAYSHQSFRFNFNNCYSGDSLMSGSFSDLFHMHNVGLKTLFYLSKPGDKGDVYGGFRWSFVKWDIRSESGQKYRAVKFFQDGFRMQGIIGYRLFFSKYFGMTFETAFGPPFFGQIGLNTRF